MRRDFAFLITTRRSKSLVIVATLIPCRCEVSGLCINNETARNNRVLKAFRDAPNGRRLTDGLIN